MKPRARTEDLEIHALDDEVVVYDLRDHRAHVLHPTVARVWRRCDGARTVDALALALAADDPALTRADLWAALDALADANLLESRVAPPAGEHRLSRRDLIRDVAAAGAVSAVPGLVGSILAPMPAMAQSSPGGGDFSEQQQKEWDAKAEPPEEEKKEEEPPEEEKKEEEPKEEEPPEEEKEEEEPKEEEKKEEPGG